MKVSHTPTYIHEMLKVNGFGAALLAAAVIVLFDWLLTWILIAFKFYRDTEEIKVGCRFPPLGGTF